MSEHIQEGRDYISELTGGYMTRDGFGDSWSERDYFFERYKSIIDGRPTWLVRNFDGEGIVVDYWVSKEAVAWLHIGGFSDAHDVYPHEKYRDKFETYRFEDLGEAVERVETFGRELT